MSSDRIQYDERGRVVLEMSVEELIKRKQAIEYLTHLEEVKEFLKRINSETVKVESDSTLEFEESLRSGIPLGILLNTLDPTQFRENLQYDKDYSVYSNKGLVFRHTNNLTLFFKGLTFYKVPEIVHPTTVDIYEKKNMPKLIYSIHFLAVVLYRMGKINFKIDSLVGKVNFNEDEISKVQNEFDKLGITLPQFQKIGGMLAEEFEFDEAARMAALIIINEAIDERDEEKLRKALLVPEASIVTVTEAYISGYMTLLVIKKSDKLAQNKEQIEGTDPKDLDYFVQNLTQAEIQETINEANLNKLLELIDNAIVSLNDKELMTHLSKPELGIKSTDLLESYSQIYLQHFTDGREKQKEIYDTQPTFYLSKQQVQNLVTDARADVEKSIQLKNSLDRINSAIRSNDLNEFKESLNEDFIKLENVNNDSHGKYLEAFNKEYKASNKYFEARDLQDVVNSVNGDQETQKQISKILENLKNYASSDNDEEFRSAIASSLLDLNLEERNMDLYKDLIKENPQYADSVADMMRMIEDAKKIYDDAYKLSTIIISLTSPQAEAEMFEELDKSKLSDLVNFNPEKAQPYLNQLNNFKKSILEEETQKPDQDCQINTKFFQCKLAGGRLFYFDEVESVVLWRNHKNQINDKLRLSIETHQAAVDRVNNFFKMTAKTDDVNRLQNLIRSLVTYKHFLGRYEHIQKHQKEILTLQMFLKSVVGRSDFYKLMSSQKVTLPTLLKFISILRPSEYDLEKLRMFAELKEKVNKGISDKKTKEAEAKELELVISLLIQSTYSSVTTRQKRSVVALPAVFESKDKNETLEKYGGMLYCLQYQPRYFGRLISIVKNRTDVIVSTHLMALFNNISSSKDEAKCLNVIHSAFEQVFEKGEEIDEMQGEQSNSMLIRVCRTFIEYLNDSKYREFLKKMIPIIDSLIESASENFSINPLEIYINVTKTDKYDESLTSDKALENSMVQKTFSEEIANIRHHIKQFFDLLDAEAENLPFAIRFMFQQVFNNPNLTVKSKSRIINNIFFQTLTNMIIIPESFDLTSKPGSSIKKNHRTLLTQFSRILKDCCRNIEYSEKYMQPLNEVISENYARLLPIYEKVIECPTPSQYYQIPKAPKFVIGSDSISIIIKDLLNLHNLLLEVKKDMIITKSESDDILFNILTNFSNPDASHFTTESNMTSQKKAEIEIRRITINLVPQIILKDKELTPKKKLTLCKMLICQLLLAVDTKNFYPTDIPMLLEHKWSDEERETHLENVGFLKRMQDKLTYFTSEQKMKHLSMDLENMVKSIVTFLEELNQLNLVSKDDNYQVIIDMNAADIRNEHNRKIEMRQEQSSMEKTMEDLEKKIKYLTEKIAYLQGYQNTFSNSKTPKQSRASIFRSKKASASKTVVMSATKLKKNKILVDIANAPNLKDIKFSFEEKGDEYLISQIVMGSPVQKVSHKRNTILLKLYDDANNDFEVIDGIKFNIRAFYDLLYKEFISKNK